MTKIYWTGLLLLCSVLSLSAQNQQELIQSFLNQHHTQQGLTRADISNWQVSSQHQSSTSGATHVYLHQMYQGIRIANGVANVAIKDNKVVSMGNRLVDNLQTRIKYTSPRINPVEAIQHAAKELKIQTPSNLRALEPINNQHFIYNTGDISKENIPVELVYFATEDNKVHLAWDLSIYQLDGEHWWSAKIDAQTGELLNATDWVVHCNFDHGGYKAGRHKHVNQTPHIPAPEGLQQPDQYMIFPLPLESPIHGSRSMVSNPADTLASPFGWHDTNGAIGAEYTITRGNNVFAYEDTNDNDSPGFSPDGGSALEFNFPYSGTNSPTANQSAAITNLFYMNNMMHDIWYQYGFDEASGNFQSNNYNRGGVDDDYVFAEAQDGGGTNNANFATPRDGFNPRMQMYLWNTSGAASANYLNINSPMGIAGPYNSIGALFGPSLPTTPLTADLVLIEDNTPDNDGCDPITNAAALVGNIAVIDRGNCAFIDKVTAAEAAGAVAVIVVNNTIDPIIQMGPANNTIGIPAIMISQADGNTIKAQIQSGTVNGSISDNSVATTDKDGDFDNGIIAHEYGHGISTRLTGGASNSNCLSNSEQMGEGWSDWFGLMLTIESGDSATDVRGIGTYAASQSTTGRGIRPAPYSTDFAVNNFTYGSSNNTAQISEPHGVGFIFATVLWDLSWALIDQYGGVPDPDIYNGTGGNNIAMNLVIEGLKLQPCNPGMIDGRDAILEADRLLYNGIHQCLIWETFAKRGFGFNASQGSSSSRTDQVESFDLSPICKIATQAPVAAFTPNSNNSCITSIAFTDNSANVVQSWYWTFGDGSSSTLQNPVHIYKNSGVYTVNLVVSNNKGQDSTIQTVTITLPTAPIVNDVEVCAGNPAYIPAITTGEARWRNIAKNIIYVGDTLTVTNTGAISTYYVENVVATASANVGPTDSNIGSGGYHNSSNHSALNITAKRSLEIVSAWVNANGAGPRTFYLAKGSNTNGIPPSGTDIVDQVTVNLIDGPQRINLNLNVPAAGNYNIGANGADLYRNNSGATYPYSAPGYMSITSSSSRYNPTNFYYYLYDLEVRDPVCVSAQDTVLVRPIVSNFSFSNTNGTLTFTDLSIDATSWHWNFGDGDTSTTQNPVHNYTNAGTFNVSLTINNGSCSSTQMITITLISIDQFGDAQLSMALMPNPTQDYATLSLGRALGEDVQVQILDITSKIYQQHTLTQGQTSLDLDVSKLPAAVYLVQLKGKDFSATQKLVVE